MLVESVLRPPSKPRTAQPDQAPGRSPGVGVRLRKRKPLAATTSQQKALTKSCAVPLSGMGIWRIPVDEIDRPGSFAWHMNRSIVLLLKVLAQLRDHSTLLKVSSMLQRTPDQGK